MKLALGTALACCSVAVSQTTPPITPLADFDRRVAAYMNIHREAEAAMGKLSTSRSPDQLEAKTKTMAQAIRVKRANASPGDIFAPPIAAEFRRLIAQSVRKRYTIRESIRSGEEVVEKLHVNGSYPVGVPLETMPPTLLMGFPVLPPELDYRFVGSMFVLRDVSANLIVDLLPDAISSP